MQMQELVEEIDRQPAWKANGIRAPHKSLTLLFAIGKVLAGQRMTRYADAEGLLIELLNEFGPPRETPHPEQPVWRLRQYNGASTSFWCLEGRLEMVAGGGGNPLVAAMRDEVAFGLSESAAELLCSNPLNARALATILAAKVVPPTRQDELLGAVGVGVDSHQADPDESNSRVPVDVELVERAMRVSQALARSSTFSRKIRAAYTDACAICAIAPRLDQRVFGLEAAHIRWAAASGPDEAYNGVLLCRMHHHAFDRGALKIGEDMRVRLSPRLARNDEADFVFGRFEGAQIRLPTEQADHPHPEMLQWHATQVFKQ